MARGRGNTIRLPRGTYSKAMLAQLVGVSPDTIEYWTKQKHLPYRRIPAGQLNVRAYSAQALEIAKALSKSSGKLSDRLDSTTT